MLQVFLISSYSLTVSYRLRHVHDAQELRPDGTTIEDQIETLMKTIANDIKETASACDYYLKKGFLGAWSITQAIPKLLFIFVSAKSIKAKIYENRLATYAAKFAEHRQAITSALSIHTTLGVEVC